MSWDEKAYWARIDEMQTMKQLAREHREQQEREMGRYEALQQSDPAAATADRDTHQLVMRTLDHDIKNYDKAAQTLERDAIADWKANMSGPAPQPHPEPVGPSDDEKELERMLEAQKARDKIRDRDRDR